MNVECRQHRLDEMFNVTLIKPMAIEIILEINEVTKETEEHRT